jgi:hypothetical protein
VKLCTSPLCDGDTTAALDLMLCWRHRNQLQLDALDAADVYDELVDRLAYGTGAPTEHRVAGSKEHGLDLDDRAVAARHQIAGILGSWAGLLIDAGAERRVSRLLDGDRTVRLGEVRSHAHLIGANASMLAAMDCAGDASEELHELAHGEPYAAAYPDGASVRQVDGEPCRREGCPGQIRAIMRRRDSLLPSALVCDLDLSHRWAPHEWALLDAGAGDELVDAGVAAAALGFQDPGAVYQMARRGILTRHDTDDGPRYQLDQVRDLRRQWQEELQAA